MNRKDVKKIFMVESTDVEKNELENFSCFLFNTENLKKELEKKDGKYFEEERICFLKDILEKWSKLNRNYCIKLRWDKKEDDKLRNNLSEFFEIVKGNNFEYDIISQMIREFSSTSYILLGEYIKHYAGQLDTGRKNYLIYLLFSGIFKKWLKISKDIEVNDIGVIDIVHFDTTKEKVLDIYKKILEFDISHELEEFSDFIKMYKKYGVMHPINQATFKRVFWNLFCAF